MSHSFIMRCAGTEHSVQKSKHPGTLVSLLTYSESVVKLKVRVKTRAKTIRIKRMYSISVGKGTQEESK